MAAAFDFKTVLDQYNRQLGYFRDTAQKVIAGMAAYAGLHAGSHMLALAEKTYAKLLKRSRPIRRRRCESSASCSASLSWWRWPGAASICSSTAASSSPIS
jgi:hypothetical protein